MNKEIRRRIKIIDSLPSEDSAMKIIYLRVTEINEKWSQRSLRGFYKCMDEIREISFINTQLSGRYGPNAVSM
jgi:transposase-like protein